MFSPRDQTIYPGQVYKLPLGFGLELPDGYVGYIFPRSSLSARGIVCELPPIDSGYRGEVHAIVSNVGGDGYDIKKGDRIGQLVIMPVVIPEFTYDVCRMMAEMTCDNVLPTIEAKGYISINDCACGAGATLIAGVHAAAKRISKAGLNWQNHILVTAQDVDYTVAYMCYIQLSLLGVAGYIKVGNSLTEPMCSDDSLESYWFTPMYCSDVWTIRRLLKGGTLL